MQKVKLNITNIKKFGKLTKAIKTATTQGIKPLFLDRLPNLSRRCIFLSPFTSSFASMRSQVINLPGEEIFPSNTFAFV